MEKRLLFWIIVGVGILAAAGFFFFGSRSVAIESEKAVGATQEHRESAVLSTLRGEPCEFPRRRPVAVMIASDAVARPLSGIASADIVVEMPVITGLVTRMMAVFQCDDVPAIGSVRSARHDFIPIAGAVDAVFAHWGGSVFSLQKLSAGVIDHLDALVNPAGTFYRVSRSAPPHNGFTSTGRLYAGSRALGYRDQSDRPAFAFSASAERGVNARLSIDYPGTFRVWFDYNAGSGLYRRLRNGAPEIDANNGRTVEVANVLVLRAASRPLLGEYNDVDIEGSGRFSLYRNGQVVDGTWKKDASFVQSPFLLTDASGVVTALEPGRTWVAVVEPGQSIVWQASAL